MFDDTWIGVVEKKVKEVNRAFAEAVLLRMELESRAREELSRER